MPPTNNPARMQQLHELEAGEQRAALDARTIELQQTRIQELEAVLALERQRGEQMAAAFVEVARTCDRRVSGLEAHQLARLASLQSSHDAALAAAKEAAAGSLAAKDAHIHTLKARVEALESEMAVMKGQHMSTQQGHMSAQLAALHAAVTAPLALEIHPVRHDRRQFAMRHVRREFDRTWCAAVCGDDERKVDLDATGMRAHVSRQAARGNLVLRGASPLPHARGETQHLPSYCVIIEAYHEPQQGDELVKQRCNIGFLPSHTVGGALVPAAVGLTLAHYGGWFIQVKPSHSLKAATANMRGWTPLPPRATAAAAAAGDDADNATSAYATTVDAPAVPPGSAVELAVDYAAGTCRVAFYTPAAVAGGFVEPPHAKMEMQFVATDAEAGKGWREMPARPVPTLPGSGVRLYPAIGTPSAGAIFRFAD